MTHRAGTDNAERPFYSWDGDTLVLNILGKPNSKKDAIGAVKGHQLCVSVKADPQSGKATDYMVRFLSDEFDVPVRDIEVVLWMVSKCSLSLFQAGSRVSRSGVVMEVVSLSAFLLAIYRSAAASVL